MLADLNTWARYKNAFGFFNSVASPPEQAYQDWKSTHILKCGQPWNLELPGDPALQYNEVRRNPDRELKKLIVTLSVVYREQFKKSGLPKELEGVAPEFAVARMRAMIDQVNGSPVDRELINLAVIPKLKNMSVASYREILRSCLRDYQTNPFTEVIKGSCGVEARW